MNEHLRHIVFKWLYYSGIKVSLTYLGNQLQSHPDYPTLSSITDTLDELGINNISLVVDKERLDEIPVPFLAHSTLNGGGFVVINNIEKQIKEDNKFRKNWNGIVVLAEKPANWNHVENEKALTKEKATRTQILLGIAVIFLLAGFPLFNNFSVSLAVLLFVSIVGLGIAILVVQQELDISNEITELLCTTGKRTDCKAVMHSKGNKLINVLNWADVGMIYFVSFLLLLVTSSARPLLSLLSVMAIPFTFFSVYYQWRVVKKWCPLCLLTIVVLVMQFALLLPVILNLTNGEIENFRFDLFVYAAFVFTIIATAWLLLVKPVLQKNKELTDKNYALVRFKNNPDIFDALLQQQRMVDVAPFENDLQLGDPQAPIQIVVACNPYCSPCARTHEILHEMVVKNDIGLTVRFSIKANEKEDKRTQTAEYILQLLVDKAIVYKRRAIHDWYLNMDMEKFMHQYPLGNRKDVDVLLIQQEQWSDKAKIFFTPTIFVNGHQLPKQYTINDLKRIIGSIEKVTKATTSDVREKERQYML